MIIAFKANNKIKIFLSLNITKRTKKCFLDINKVGLIFFISLLLFSNIYFIIAHINCSGYFVNHNLEKLKEVIEKYENDEKWLFMNFKVFMRPYLLEKKPVDIICFPLPPNEGEFLELLSLAPNGTLIIFSNDRSLTWYEYGSSYAKKYWDHEEISLNKVVIRFEEELKNFKIFRIYSLFNVKDAVKASNIHIQHNVSYYIKKARLRLQVRCEKEVKLLLLISTPKFTDVIVMKLKPGMDVIEREYKIGYLRIMAFEVKDHELARIYDCQIWPYVLTRFYASIYVIILTLIAVLFIYLLRGEEYEAVSSNT
ncbi:MAG: hypothetical protein DRJ47_09985 [Thermoprotei archaeon]|nr:MAG: hypothetical protein DRJ47_09985 [Thermoprotei archaeon]